MDIDVITSRTPTATRLGEHFVQASDPHDPDGRKRYLSCWKGEWWWARCASERFRFEDRAAAEQAAKDMEGTL